MATKTIYNYEKARLVKSSDFADSILEQTPAIGKLEIDIDKETAWFTFSFGENEQNISLDIDLSGGVEINAPTDEGILVKIYEVNEAEWIFIAEGETTNG